MRATLAARRKSAGRGGREQPTCCLDRHKPHDLAVYRTVGNAVRINLGQPHGTIQNAGHFVQEDEGEALAGVIVAFIAQIEGGTGWSGGVGGADLPAAVPQP